MARPRLTEPEYRLACRNGVYYVTWTEVGRSRGITTGCRDETAAKVWRRQFVAAQQAPSIPVSPTIGAILDGYIEDRRAIVASIATLEHAAKPLRRALGDLLPDQITIAEGRRYARQRRLEGRRDGTVIREVVTPRAALAWAVRRGWIGAAPKRRLTAWVASAALALALACSPALAAKPAPTFPPTPFAILAPDTFWTTVEMADLPRWQRVRDWILADGPATRSPAAAAWARWAESLRGLPRDALLADVHREVTGRITYASDGAEDYWQTPAETIERGKGDCEDYAILGLWLLRLAGMPDDQLAVVFGLDETGAKHAVLLAGRMVLDNRRPTVVGAAAFAASFRLQAAAGLRYVIAAVVLIGASK